MSYTAHQQRLQSLKSTRATTVTRRTAVTREYSLNFTNDVPHGSPGADWVDGCLFTCLLPCRESYTESLRTSIKNHAYENGRRYHSYRGGSMWVLAIHFLFALVEDHCLLNGVKNTLPRMTRRKTTALTCITICPRYCWAESCM
jgi:hypothetical protein